ncbi:MAG: flagellar protein [Lachnospiraceae bacterium]|nr:flagellar protein [Lachnospiraceae bacterium]
MDIQTQGFLSIDQMTDKLLKQSQPVSAGTTSNGLTFEDVLKQKITGADAGEIKFSKHAATRLSDRNITLTQSQMDRLSEGTRKAESKGIKDSLVLVDSLAFIVNVPNSTVITAMDATNTDENVFTNINGAVIA